MNRTKQDLINDLMKIKKELKLVKSNHKNRRTFITLKEAEKTIRKVATHVSKDSRKTEHIQCKLYLPACYACKKVRVIAVKEDLEVKK